jgi:RHS repeat-associated protein
MAAKGKALSIALAIVAIFASSPLFASIPRSTVIDPSPIDLLRVAPASDHTLGPEPSLPVFTRENLDQLAGIARIELPQPSISETLEWRTSAMLSAYDDARKHRTFDAVSAELASWPLAWLDENNIKGERQLSLKLHRATEFQALPFAEPATGLVYARARWYDPATGSFLSPDPRGYQDSSNLYAFAGGDPVNRRDPTGTDAVSKAGVFVGTDANGRLKKVDYRKYYNGDVSALYQRLAADGVPMHLRDLIVERVSGSSQGTAIVSELAPQVVARSKAYALHGASAGLSFSLVGDAKDLVEGVSGRDFITGERFSGKERLITLGAAALPFVGGKAVRELVKATSAGGAENAVEEIVKKTTTGYGVNDPPVRIQGEWSINDLKQGLLGHPPRGLGSPDLHHADQMPGSGRHEVLPGAHRNNPDLHPNRYNQGVTPQMREQDRRLHWWYRAREQGADELLPDWIYD